MEDQNFKAVRNMSTGGLSGQEYVNASVVWSRAGCTCSRYSESSRYSENFEGQVVGALSIEIYEYMSLGSVWDSFGYCFSNFHLNCDIVQNNNH